jgi:flavin-dependent dehydrogenase
MAEPRIEFSQGVAVERVAQAGGVASLQTSAGDIRVRYVAVADGLRSGIRRQLGWTQGPRPPHRYGVVGHWRGAFPQDSWIRLTIESGFESYRAPVGPDEHLVALLCGRTRMAMFGRDLIGQYRARARALHPDLDQADLSGEVSAIGPFRYGAGTVARDGIFLVGDASGFVDPITGEGLASGLVQAQALVAALEHPHPEAAYRGWHRRITQGPRRLTSLLVYLATSASRAARAVRGMQAQPSAMQRFLGINLGYWGFARVTPREWIALLAGR